MLNSKRRRKPQLEVSNTQTADQTASSIKKTFPGITQFLMKFSWLIYLLLIPIYSLIYFYYRADFYHSSSQYEASLANDFYFVYNGIVKSFIANLKSVYNQDIIISDNLEHRAAIGTGTLENAHIVDVNIKGNTPIKVTFDKLEITNDSMLMMFVLLEWYDASGNKTIHGYKVRIDCPFFHDIKTKNLCYIKCTIGQEANGSAAILRNLFPQNPEFLKQMNASIADDPGEKSNGYLFLDADVAKRIIAFNSAMHGFPSETFNEWSRMLYFSTVTITTVGYGDIVPLTSTTRMIVSSEAILGVIFIGLYVNYLSKGKEK